MQTLKEGLLNKKNIKDLMANKYNITKKDLIDDLAGFPLGVVIKMMEEQEKQGNKSDIRIFQRNNAADKWYGFSWADSDDGTAFWHDIIVEQNFNLFYRKYPKYKKYDI